MRPGKCLDRIIRMKAIEKEYQVAIVARDVLSSELGKKPSTLTDKGLEQVHFDNFRDNLDSTYLIRIFAEFETGLRDYWKYRLRRDTAARISDMIKSTSSRQKIDYQKVENVDDVRKYRNRLVHEEDSEARVVNVGDARKFLCIFFGRLPEDW
jgi:hypothetical protein